MKKQPDVTERTRQKFVDAFWELAKVKPIRKIAVSELTRIAGYNRSTFYEYFLDTDDLLSYVEDKLITEVKKTALEVLSEDKMPAELFRIIFTTMNEEIYILSGPNGDSGFFSRIKAELVPVVSKYLPIREDEENFDYLVCFVNSAMLGLLEHWHDKNKDITVEEISKLVQRLMMNGVLGYVSTEISEEK